MTLDGFLSASVSWWDVSLAVIAIVAGFIASRFAKRGVAKLVARVPNATGLMISIASRVAQYTVLLLGVGLALAFLGANVQPLLAVVIIVGVIAVIILRGVADNFAAGVLIQARRPVVAGEEVMVTGPDDEPIVGVVTELTSRTVILRSYDGRTVHVPNADLLSNTIVNHSRHGARRSEVQVRVALSETASVDRVVARAAEVAASISGVHQLDAPRVIVTAVSPDRLRAQVQFWHDPADGVTVPAAVVRALAADFSETGIDATVSRGTNPPPFTPMDAI